METIGSPAWDPYSAESPTRLVLDRLADKWTVLVVGRLATGTKRFGELKRTIGGVSQKSLTMTLREMERDGIVKRRVYASVPPKVEYSLTPLGQTLVELLKSVRCWAETDIEQVIAAQQTYDGNQRDEAEAHISE